MQQEWELEAALRRLEAVEGELKVEAGARAICEREAADLGRQVVLLQAQLNEAAALIEETAAPDRLRTHLRQQQLQQQVKLINLHVFLTSFVLILSLVQVDIFFILPAHSRERLRLKLCFIRWRS